MHDDSVLVAIDAALHAPAFCTCGNNLAIAVHHDAAWLECPTYASPTHLPALVASIVRGMLHDRRFVINIGAAASVSARPIESRGAFPTCA